jgi:outer membrane receptor protein involved in Fe transport
MPYQPDFAGDLYVGGVIAQIWLRGAVRIEGSRTTTLAAVRRLPAYAVARFDASRGFRIGSLALEAALAVDNLFDVRYELIELYPQPGRSLLFRLELRR